MEQSPNRRDDGLLLTLLGVSLIMVIFGIIWASLTNENVMGGMMGHQNNGSTGSPIGTSIAIIGVFLVVVFLILIALGRSRRAPSLEPQPVTAYQYPPYENGSSGVTEDDMHQLTIRLLSGDERKMFRRIVDAGGEVLQKDLVAEGTFSKAKVTRLLDKLENKGLLIRERYGSTNRVRISKDLGR